MNMRTSFEKYCASVGLSTRLNNRTWEIVYEWPDTEIAWQSYQEAFNMQQAVIDEMQKSLDKYEAEHYNNQMSE